MTASVNVVKLALGHRVIHIDSGEEQFALFGHLFKAVDSCGGFFRNAFDLGGDLVPVLRIFSKNLLQQCIDDLEFNHIGGLIKNGGIIFRSHAPVDQQRGIASVVNDLVRAVGHSENPYKVLSGGPMMGVAQYDLAVPVIKGTNAVTILGKKNRYIVDQSRCIRCGKCIEVCPMSLLPVLMYKSLYSGDVEEMKAQNLMDCIECGCCAYTCPACVPLVLGF